MKQFPKEDFEELGEPPLSGARAFETTILRRKRRRPGDSAAIGLILSNNLTTDSAVNGTVVGVLSVQGSADIFTFSFLSNLGNLFSLTGANLKVAAAPLIAGIDPIAIQADNGAGLVIVQAFAIIVSHLPVGYIPTYELWGF